MIKAILIINNHGKPRLLRFYEYRVRRHAPVPNSIAFFFFFFFSAIYDILVLKQVTIRRYCIQLSFAFKFKFS